MIGVAAYFTPTIFAAIRKVPNFGSVFGVNIFLGWTLIGWVVAFAMAARSATSHVQAATQPGVRSGGTPATIVWTHSGFRYLMGYILRPAVYGIWDRQAPGPPIFSFPYTEHGQGQAATKFRELEPAGVEVATRTAPPPPPPHHI
jgi:hypothetical protein